MTPFPTHLWIVAIRESLLWFLNYKPPVVNAVLRFGEPRKMTDNPPSDNP